MIETLEDIIAEMREYAWKLVKDQDIAATIEAYTHRLESAAIAECDKAYEAGRSAGYQDGYDDCVSNNC